MQTLDNAILVTLKPNLKQTEETNLFLSRLRSFEKRSREIIINTTDRQQNN
ncbi:hypothetical protein M0P65_01295 [Candidatus Gracilibacteria bacterium]|jgi:hypothetical protein|nr:hypothetical protein [Candidatus Gracilibacteria bacterium]